MEGILESEVGIIITKDISAEIMDKSRRMLSVRQKLPPNIPNGFKTQTRVLKLYKSYDREHFIIAKSIAKVLLKNINYNYKKIRKFDKFDIAEHLADHQKIIINYIINHKFATSNMTGEVLLQLNTGLGKTRVGLGLISRVGAVSAAVVPTKHIAQQWVDEIRTYAPQLRVCIYENPKNQSTENYDVMIIIVNTARNKERSFFSNFALVLLDEVHELTSKTNKNVLWNISCCRFVCGLTATPDPNDTGLLRFIEGHLGPTLYAKNIPQFDVNCKVFDVNVLIVNYSGQNEYLQPVINTGGTVCAIATIERLISDPERVRVTTDQISRLYDTGNNVLVFAEHRAHLDSLYSILKTKYDDNEIDIEVDVLKGGATKDTIEKAATMRIILTTYGYSRRGVSYNHLNALVLATPRRSGLEQILGRILRYNSDNSIPRYVIDIHDCASVLKGQLYSRLKVYKERKYDIKYQRIDTDDSE